MFNSVVLDIVIGLIFVFLLYSLFATIIQEMVSSWYGLRAKMLRKSMELMLNGKTTYKTERDAEHWARYLLLLEKEGYEYSFAAQFYNSSLIKSLGKADKDSVFGVKNTKPAYISSANFSEVLVYLLKQRGFGQTDMEKIGVALKFNTYHIKSIPLKRLNHIYSESAGDMQVFRLKLEQWFNDTMDRSTGWYKRILKLWLFIIGLSMAIMFDANTFDIIKKLSDDPKARTELVKMAVESVDSTSKLGKKLQADSVSFKNDYKEIKNSLDTTNKILGNGWNPGENGNWIIMILGYIIMALAISLGSSFWFDLLKKLVAIRGVGVKPEEKQESKPEPQKESNQNPSPATVKAVNEPVIYGSLLDEVLAKHKDEILKIPGVQSVLKVFDEADGKLQINVKDELTAKVIEEQLVPELKNRNVQIVPEIVITGIATSHGVENTEWTNGAIANKSGNNGYGSMGAVMYHPASKNYYFLSCWHVLNDDANYDKEADAISNKIIIDHQKKDIGTVKSGGLGGVLDYGFAKCLDQKKMDNSFLKQTLGINGDIVFRPVTTKDYIEKTPVKYYDWMNKKEQAGIIYSVASEVIIWYADRFRTMNDVLMIRKSMTENSGISQPGNSGSMLFDHNGNAIGLIFAGDKKYSYAIKLKYIMSLYKEYQFA